MNLNLNSIAVSANRPMPPLRPKTVHPEPPALVVFGKDDGGKPHASWFDAEEAPLAMKAAGLMGMVVLPVDKDELRALALKAPHGKVFASGKAFVPFVKAALFEDLVGYMPDPNAWPDRPERPAKPEKLPRAGKRANSYAAAKDGSPSAQKPRYPKDWDAIAVGDTVLACEADQDGWFEAKVVEVKPGAQLTLQWRDWPDLPPFLRKAQQVALIHPDCDL